MTNFRISLGCMTALVLSITASAQTIPNIPDSWLIIYEDNYEAAKKKCNEERRDFSAKPWNFLYSDHEECVAHKVIELFFDLKLYDKKEVEKMLYERCDD